MTKQVLDSSLRRSNIGSRPIRHDGVPKVTGEACFGADISLPGMIYAKVLRSPYAHAIIKSVDVTVAEASKDVIAIVTGSDLYIEEKANSANEFQKNNILARNRVLYKGHPVAAIAANNLHAAEEALSLIKVEYEPLPFVTDVNDAMSSEAPILHEALQSNRNASNIVDSEIFEHGNIRTGFDDADVIVERQFKTKSVHQGYIEPQNATAVWEQDGRLTIWCSSQGHFGIRDNVAAILGLDVSNIKVVPMEIGGGFGGKISPYLEPLAALLSKKSGRPVKMVMSRNEVFESTGPAAGGNIRVKLGANSLGRIVAAEAHCFYEAGAYPGAPLAGAAAGIFAPYSIDNVRIEAYDVVDNKPKTSAYRAPGATVAVFAAENVIDEIAHQLNLDPMEFRLINVAEEGSRRADGVVNVRIGAKQVMDAVRKHSHYSSKLKGKFVGRGVAMGFCRNNTGMACVVANVLDDGKVSLVEGSVDIGGSRTSVSQQFAEVLGIPVEDVIPQVADTDTVGYTSVTGGSGVAYKSGWAAFEAAHDVKRQLLERVALLWETSIENLEYRDAIVRHKFDTELTISFREITSLLTETGGPVVGRANISPGGLHGSYSANIVDVEVDMETGKVEIIRVTAFQDAGTAVHPGYVEGQIQGGTVQGIGWALNEGYFMGIKGEMMNPTFLDYRMPTSYDVPMIDPVILEVPSSSHPFGVRGVGEANIVPPPAAIANAIYDAIGVRMYELPILPENVLEALES